MTDTIKYRIDKTRPTFPLEKPAISSPTSQGMRIIMRKYTKKETKVNFFHFLKTSSEDKNVAKDEIRNAGPKKDMIVIKLYESQQLHSLGLHKAPFMSAARKKATKENEASKKLIDSTEIFLIFLFNTPKLYLPSSSPH